MDDGRVRKIVESLERASKNIIKTSGKTVEDEEFQLSIWHAAAEAEYAAFLLSIYGQLHNFYPEPRHTPNKQSSTGDYDDGLSEAKSLLSKAIELVGSDLKSAYENVRSAIFILRNIENKSGKRSI
ncbi:hypothetical protein KEJ51_01340 [Candidatus Bathyarchaeota archaeon]|nr:hypothetical protein [Candidatus Bathyarchaeota archaeon]